MRSFTTLHKSPSTRTPKPSFFPEMTKKLEQGSRILSYVEFRQLFEEIFKKSIKKTETNISNKQSSLPDTIQYLNIWLQKYGSNPELQIRLLILESHIYYKQSPQDSLAKLNKVKHLVVQTKFEYLLPKIFFLQSKIFEHLKQSELRFKSLKKSIEYGENYVVEYLKESNEARLELADTMTISYFEMYKYNKQENPESYDAIIHILNKAYKAALKNYGPQHFSTLSLIQILEQQKKLKFSINRLHQPKPITQICIVPIKKYTTLQIVYNWQEQALIISIRKQKKLSTQERQGPLPFQKQQRIIGQSYHPIKLDMNCIKNLKNANYKQYLQIGINNQITIFQQELNTILTRNYSQNNISINQNQSNNDRKNNASLLKAYSRQQLVKGDTQRLSSSSEEDDDILGQQKPLFLDNNFNYFGHSQNFCGSTRQLTNTSRSKSKDIKNISRG